MTDGDGVQRPLRPRPVQGARSCHVFNPQGVTKRMAYGGFEWSGMVMSSCRLGAAWRLDRYHARLNET